MKTTKEILKNIETNRNIIKEFEEKADAIRKEKNSIRNAYQAAPDKGLFRKTNDPRMDQLTIEAGEITDAIKEITVINKILMHNYRIALFEEIAPAIVETLTKYNGKAYGPKTREKIRNEISVKTGCHFYIQERSYCSEIHISNDVLFYSNALDIETWTDDDAGNRKRWELLPGNKINAPALENLKIYNSEYIDDPAGRARELKAAYENILEKKDELEKSCNAYNEIICFSMEPAYGSKNFYSGCYGE